MITVSSRLAHASPEFVFSLVSQFPPCLSLDVGAAMGTVARQLQQASPSGRTICFEPWQGNLPYFREITEGISGISLVEKAVADFDGPGVFFVPSVVQGHERGWGKRPGYSSTGMLIPAAEAAGKPGEKVFNVDVCSLDSCVDERVRFLKIDVQGGEGAVLRGASKLIDRGLIDMMFVEFQGEEDVVEFAASHGYAIFDTEYNAIPVGVEPDKLGFRAGYHQLPLSN
ncbi:MAG: FkbM family methyltransferase, partial [Hyphomicrobium sp.]